MEANQAFLRREQAESDAFLTELDAEIEPERNSRMSWNGAAAAAHAAGAGHGDRRDLRQGVARIDVVRRFYFFCMSSYGYKNLV